MTLERSRVSLRVVFASLLATLVCTQPLRAQCADLTPTGPSMLVNVGTSFIQKDGAVQVTPDGLLVATAFTTGQDIFLHLFDSTGASLTGDIFVNSTLNAGNQDQPALGIDSNGRILVAWSDRNGTDGENIGIYARIFDSSGTPVAGEFQVNVIWEASQFTPSIVPRSGGGWIVSWTGGFVADCFFTLLDTNGNSLTAGDVLVNSFITSGQLHAAPAQLSNGDIFFAFEDSSNFMGIGSGRNVWARIFDPTGVPRGAEFEVTDTQTAGDQRNVRTAADGQGRAVVVWEDQQNDGDGWGVYGRVFNSSGSATTGLIQLATTTAGDQRTPNVAMDSQGNWIVTWEDSSSGDIDVLARRFAADGQPSGDPVIVNETSAGNQADPAVSIDAAGDDVAIVYEGPFNNVDVFVRLFSSQSFTPPVNYCTPIANSTGSPAILSWSGSTSVANADLVLCASSVPANDTGLFIYSLDRDEVMVGNGNLCIGAQTLGFFIRGPGGFSNGAGVACFVIPMFDPSVPKSLIAPGSTWDFQYWYRDHAAGGSEFNFSDGLEIVFCP